MKSENVYFKGLTELRGVAALLVVFHHIELYKFRLSEPSLFGGIFNLFIGNLGKNGVYVFFVLSGFLITYLLLKEKEKTDTISVRKFYLRRVLRIWPLYFIVLIISFWIVPHTYGMPFWIHEIFYQKDIGAITYGWNLVLFLFFLSNVALKIFPAVAGASQSWSVSVEEQFYLIWPVLLKKTPSKKILPLLIVIACKPAFLWAIAKGLSAARLYTKKAIFIISVVDGMKFEFMAMGGLLAVLVWHYKPLFEKVFKSKIAFTALVLFTLILMGVNSNGYILSILYACIIGFIVSLGIEQKGLKKIGTVSYGIYMYHPLVMYCSFALIHTLVPNASTVLYNALVYPLILGISYLLSLLSYKYVESYFMKLKTNYAVVKSSSTELH